MSFWIGLVIFFSICIVAQYFIKEKDRHIIPKVMMGVLAFLSAFRYEIGVDYNNYVYLFETVDVNSNLEPFFKYLVVILNKLGFDFQMLFVVYSVATSVFIWKGFRYYLKDWQQITLGVALFAMMISGWWYSMIIIRQYLAVAIFFWGSRYIIERKFIKYLLVVILMSLMHYSAIFLICLYFLANLKLRKSVYCLLFLFGMITAKTGALAGVFKGVLMMVGMERYIHYIQVSGVTFDIGLGYLFFFLIGILILCLIDEEKEKENICKNMYLFGLLIQVTFCFFGIVSRTRFYFDLFGIISLIFVIYRTQYICPNLWKVDIRKVVELFFVICFAILMLREISKLPSRPMKSEIYINNIEYSFNFKLIKNNLGYDLYGK